MTLTEHDLDEIEKIVDEKITARTRNLPTKDDFSTQMSEVVGELKAIRENQEAATGRRRDLEDRVETIETKLGITPA